jgi:hypothetical protein
MNGLAPRFPVAARVAFNMDEAVLTKSALLNMQSAKYQDWPMFPSPIFYRPAERSVFFSIFIDISRVVEAMNLDINFNLKDLKYSTMFLEDKYSWLQGPGIEPIKIKIEAKDIQAYYYKLNKINLSGTPENTIVYKLEPLTKSEYYSISPSYNQTYSWDNSNRPWKF